MGPKPFSKAWRQELIRRHTKARVVMTGKFPAERNGVELVPFNPVERQVSRLAS